MPLIKPINDCYAFIAVGSGLCPSYIFNVKINGNFITISIKNFQTIVVVTFRNYGVIFDISRCLVINS